MNNTAPVYSVCIFYVLIVQWNAVIIADGNA